MKITKAATPPMQRVRAAVLGWLGFPVGLSDSDLWSPFAGNTSQSGANVNEATMLTLSTVWACARLVSETIATMPLKLYERGDNGRSVALNHPLYSIIHDTPNIDSTASMFWQGVVAAMLLRGAARIEKLQIGPRTVGLQFLAPSRLVVSRGSDGKWKYRYTNDDGSQREIPASRIMTIPGFTLDGIHGVSVIRYGSEVFGGALAANEAAAGTFKKGLMPTVAFKMTQLLKPTQREEFRENFEKIAGAVNAGRPVLLEGGMETQTIGINPNDAQLLESRGFGVEEICRWFRVPPWMVGHSAEGATKWGSGMEQEMIAFVAFTLQPWLTRISQGIAKDLIAPQDRARYYAEFDVNSLLRADSAGRAAFYSTMVNNGIFVRDDVREKENLPRLGGNAAVLTVQSAMVPLDDIGNTDPATRANAMLAQLISGQAPQQSSETPELRVLIERLLQRLEGQATSS